MKQAAILRFEVELNHSAWAMCGSHPVTPEIADRVPPMAELVTPNRVVAALEYAAAEGRAYRQDALRLIEIASSEAPLQVAARVGH